MKPNLQIQKKKKVKIALILKNAIILLNGRQKVHNVFESLPKEHSHTEKMWKYLPRAAKVSECKQLKILTPKQMLQRLPTALAQVKAGNASENLLNEMRQIMYLLYWAKRISKEVYNNIKNSIEL